MFNIMGLVETGESVRGFLDRRCVSKICIGSLLNSSLVSCSSEACKGSDQAVEKGRTIDGAVGENVSLVVSLFCSTSL